MSSRKKFRVSTIEEVWEFLHAFVVEAARTGTDLEEDGTVSDGIDVSGLVGDLYIRGADSNKGMLYDQLAYSLGTTWLQTKSIIRGWDGFSWKDRIVTLGEWPRLGRQLRYAYLQARRDLSAVCSVPWPGRLPNPCWRKQSDVGSILWLPVQVVGGTPNLATRRINGKYYWFNSLTRTEGVELTEYLARIAVEDSLAQYVDALQGALQCNKPTWR